METKVTTVKDKAKASLIAQLASHVAAGLSGTPQYTTARTLNTDGLARAAVDTAIKILELAEASIKEAS